MCRVSIIPSKQNHKHGYERIDVIDRHVLLAPSGSVLERHNLRQTAVVPRVSAVEHSEGILFGARSPL